MPRLKFGKTTVAALPHSPKRVTYWDTEVRGLCLRVGSDSKVYYAAKRNPVTKKWVFTKVGSTAELSVDEARKEAELKLKDIRTNAAVASRGVPTMKELVDDYLELYCKTNHRDQGKAVRQVLYHDVIPKFGAWPANKVSRAHLVRLFDEKAVKAPGAAIKVRVYCSKLFKWAIPRGIYGILESPVWGTQRPAKPGRKSHTLNDLELGIFWRSTPLLPDPIVAFAMKALVLTLARRGEVLGMKWSEVDWENRLWTIPGERTKNGLEFTIPLTAVSFDLFSELHKLTGHTAWAFWSDRIVTSREPGPVKKDVVTRWIIAHQEKHPELFKDVRRFTVHDLRRTSATLAARLTGDKNVPKLLLNHKDTSVTGVHYDMHTYDREKLRALELLHAHITKVAEGKTAPSTVVPFSRGR